MEDERMVVGVAAGIALSVLAIWPAAAAEWESYVAFTYESRTVALPDGRSVTTFTNNGAYQNIWPDRATAGTLACTGMIEKTADEVAMEAYCEHVDADGDRYFQRSQRTGPSQGREQGLGGTGKHAGREWQCDYEVTYVSDNWGVVHAQCQGDPPKS